MLNGEIERKSAICNVDLSRVTRITAGHRSNTKGDANRRDEILRPVGSFAREEMERNIRIKTKIKRLSGIVVPPSSG